MTQQPLSILISGAGVAGLTLALSLAKQSSCQSDISITIVERSATPRTTGQAIDIRGPGVDVITRLNLEPQVKARHTTETGMIFINENGGHIAKIDMTGNSKAQSVTSEYEILRGELTGLLLEGVNEAKDKGTKIKMVCGEYIASLENLEHGIDVKFTNGKLQDQTFDVVIASDGSTSRTRSMIFTAEEIPQPVQASGMYVAFFTIPRIDGDDTLLRWCTLPGGLAMQLRPHRDPKTMGLYLTITNSTNAAVTEIDEVIRQGVPAQKEYLRKIFQNRGWQSERFLKALDDPVADDFYMTHWCSVRTPIWTKNRCVILGDTAFATMGIGTSLAMIGGYVLAGELSKAKSSADVSKCLTEYERILRPLVNTYGMKFAGFPQVMSPQSMLGVKALRSVVWTVTALKLPQMAMWWYAGSEGKQKWRLPEYELVE